MNFDKLIVFDTDYIYFIISDIIYRFVISKQVIEIVKYGSSFIYID